MYEDVRLSSKKNEKKHLEQCEFDWRHNAFRMDSNFQWAFFHCISCFFHTLLTIFHLRNNEEINNNAILHQCRLAIIIMYTNEIEH